MYAVTAWNTRVWFRTVIFLFSKTVHTSLPLNFLFVDIFIIYIYLYFISICIITAIISLGIWIWTDVSIYRDYLQRRDGRLFLSRLRQRLQPPASTQVSTVCPRSSDPFHIVSYYINWVTSSWTYSIMLHNCHVLCCILEIAKEGIYFTNATLRLQSSNQGPYHVHLQQ